MTLPCIFMFSACSPKHSACVTAPLTKVQEFEIRFLWVLDKCDENATTKNRLPQFLNGQETVLPSLMSPFKWDNKLLTLSHLTVQKSTWQDSVSLVHWPEKPLPSDALCPLSWWSLYTCFKNTFWNMRLQSGRAHLKVRFRTFLWIFICLTNANFVPHLSMTFPARDTPVVTLHQTHYLGVWSLVQSRYHLPIQSYSTHQFRCLARAIIIKTP